MTSFVFCLKQTTNIHLIKEFSALLVPYSSCPLIMLYVTYRQLLHFATIAFNLTVSVSGSTDTVPSHTLLLNKIKRSLKCFVNAPHRWHGSYKSKACISRLVIFCLTVSSQTETEIVTARHQRTTTSLTDININK
jgi:hypothetical protein